MKKELEIKRRMVSIGLIILAIVVIIIMLLNGLGSKTKTNNTATPNDTNYVSTAEGNKVNTSPEVSSNKKVGEILLEKSQIVYENGTSKLTSKVTNDGTKKDNLRFKVKFIANDGSTIAESIGFVGAINANETKYIDSYITLDVSNAKNVAYEIME